MIQHLFIRDFALIDHLETSFGEGLSILTGQTGAGKSIIIGALNLVLGERADQSMIRKGASKAIIEMAIRCQPDPDIHRLLDEAGIETEGTTLVLRREIRDYGSRAYINDHPVPVGILRQIGDKLVDLHGQHEHQLLLRDEHHRAFLDRFAQVSTELEQYRASRKNANQAEKELQELRQRERDLRERRDLNTFKLRELDEAGLKDGEEDELKSTLLRMENAEDLASHASSIVQAGGGGDVNASDLLRDMIRHIEAMAEIEPEFSGYQTELESARVSIDEAVRFAAQYAETIEYHPSELDKLRKRQSDLNRLKKKYLADLPELITLREQLREEIRLTESFESEILKLEKQSQSALEKLRDAAITLEERRKKAGEMLSARVIEELASLGMPHVRFAVVATVADIRQLPLNAFRSAGPGEIHFHIATNKGEDLKPLAKIASGGEISRVMLSLKSVLAHDDAMPVMIFDEIDTGISGNVSEMVGRAMKKLSRTCQILAITHQPQIAARADHHYRIEKHEEDDRTVTRIVKLTSEEHIREVAALMSGSVITEAALASAKEMIEGE